MILALLLLTAQQGPLPEYPVAIRCAALAGAAHRQDKTGPKARAHFDALVFWSMATSERARKDGMTAARMEADLDKAGAGADAELKGGKAEARAELAACLAKVPNLKQ